MKTPQEFKVGQTISIPLLPNHGKGIIYAIAPKNKSGYTHYIQFADKIGKRIMPPELLKAEEIPVEFKKRWVTPTYEEDGEFEEIYIPDSPCLEDSFGEMPSYAN